MQFEWMWKHMAPIKSHGKKSRLTKLLALLQKERWTEQAPLAASVPLVITIHNYDDDDNITNNPFLQQTLLENKELPEHVKVQIISREGDKEG